MGRRGYGRRNKNALLVLILMVLIVVVVVVAFNSMKQAKKDQDTETSAKQEQKDNVAPELVLNEERTILAVGEKYTVKATAKDDLDGDLTSKIQFSEIDTSKEGEYDITLSVSDNAGNKTEKVQKVVVRSELTNGLPILMYHFFYDNIKYSKRDNNWLKAEDFEAQLKYMTENDFYFPTWDEVSDYIDGKIKLPSKSVVLTVDDGDDSFFDVAVPLLQKYKVPATSFVITAWYGQRYDANMQYVVWGSHSSNMHEAGANGKGRMVNWAYDEIVADLKASSEALGGTKVFCYPFGHYNETAIKALKDTNYTLAITVDGGRVKKNTDKYKLPRVRVTDGNSLKYFISSIS